MQRPPSPDWRSTILMGQGNLVRILVVDDQPTEIDQRARAKSLDDVEDLSGGLVAVARCVEPDSVELEIRNRSTRRLSVRNQPSGAATRTGAEPSSPSALRRHATPRQRGAAWRARIGRFKLYPVWVSQHPGREEQELASSSSSCRCVRSALLGPSPLPSEVVPAARSASRTR